MTRTQAIREAEGQQVPYRLYQPKHPGKTWTDYKAERARKRQILAKRAFWLTLILTAATVAAKSCVN